tara:strand:- start:6799 stop:7200 length:402 start_codon:yes stop_codon:yes gene_type:complete
MENWKGFINENRGKSLQQAEWKELIDRVKRNKSGNAKLMARDWEDRSREPSTEKDVAAVRAWLSSNGYQNSNVFDGSDPNWKIQASDEDFLILSSATSGDFDYHTMKKGAEPINLVFIKSVSMNEPVYAYVRY